jgi:hypothetical protein
MLTRSRRLPALLAGAIGVAGLGAMLSTEAMAAATLTLSPIAGPATAAFTASYSGGANCRGDTLQIRWSTQGGPVLGSAPTPGNSCSLTIGNLKPPAGTAPGKYTVWGVMVGKGSAQPAPAAYTVQAPSPPPPASPPITTTAGTPTASSTLPTATATTTTTATATAGASAPGATPQVAVAGGGGSRPAALGAAIGGGAGASVPPGAQASPCAGCSAGRPGASPAILALVGGLLARWPLPATSLGVLLVALVTWWIYGSPMPGAARGRRAPAVEPVAAADTALLDGDPAPLEREIYSPAPGGEPRYRGRVIEAPARGLGQAPDVAQPGVIPLDMTYPGADDGLPPMAAPPRD